MVFSTGYVRVTENMHQEYLVDAYHAAVKGVGATLSQQILDDGAPPSTEPDKRFFSITHAYHCMLETTTIRGVIPLIRFPFTRHKKVMAAFSQQYRLLSPGAKLTKAGVDRAWRAMLGAPLPGPAAGSETAVPDDTVAEKAPPGENSEVRQSRGDKVQGPAVGLAAAGDESDSSQIGTFEGLCRAASWRERRRERAAAAAAAAAAGEAKAGD